MSGRNTIALSRIQKLIGARMLQSKQEKPCFYLESVADVTDFMGMRPSLRKSLGVKVTTNAFYIRALAAAAARYPLVAAVPPGPGVCESVVVPRSINVGFAVNAPQGLVVPVIKQAQGKNLGEIAQLEKTLTELARDNKLSLEQMTGANVALSNLGPYDIDWFVGIVPPQTSTILAVGKVIRTAMPRDGKLVERKTVSLTLAADHRILEGAYAGRFLSFLAERLENPAGLL